MGKKKFIDKKASATYRLVFKESSCGVGEGDLRGGSERVFVRVDGGDAHVPGFDLDTEGEDEDERGDQDRGPGRRGDRESGRLEMLELGFPDDGYDYLQHLREVGASGRIGSFVPANHVRLDPLRADVKAYDASKVKVLPPAEEHGDDGNAWTINGSVHRIRVPASKVIDSDVAASLDKDDSESFVSEDELEDDFVAIANEGAENLPLQENGSDKHVAKPSHHVCEEPVEADDFESNEMPNDRPTRFLDEQFELLALREYEDDDIGELDYDDFAARGPVHISKFDNVVSDFLVSSTFVPDKYQTPAELESSMKGIENDGDAEPAGSLEKVEAGDSLYVPSVEKLKTQALATLNQGIPSDEELELVGGSDTDDDEGRWDCETIVSTYSNLDNHPGTIGAFPKVPHRSSARSVEEDGKPVIRLRGKQQLPVDYLPKRSSNPQESEKNRTSHHPTLLKSGVAQLPEGRSRADESKEEKKARKAAVKAERRAARVSKKDTKLLYKDESQKAQRTAAFTGPATLHL